jgi:hypothetical protein
MNTTRKGDAFELRVFNALKEALNSKHLGLFPDSCQIFHKKRYYSRDRESEIEIDVSIEVSLPGADTWSLLWAWECKDYKKNIPVDDLEEFWAKLQQIGSVNIKGGFATSGALQESALTFAKSKGFTIVRLLPDDQISYPVYAEQRSQSSPEVLLDAHRRKVQQALTLLGYRGDRRNFYGLHDNRSSSFLCNNASTTAHMGISY